MRPDCFTPELMWHLAAATRELGRDRGDQGRCVFFGEPFPCPWAYLAASVLEAV